MAYDQNAVNMINAAVSQTQAKIKWYSTLLAQNPNNGMYRAAIQQEQQRLAQYQQNLGQQTATPQINEAQYGQQKADINQQFGAQISAADYARTIAQQRHSRALGDFNTASTRQRNSFDSPYLGRGMFRSGQRRQGLQQLRSDQQTAYGGMVQQQTEELGTLAQQRAQLMANRTSALSAVDRARQQAIFQQLSRVGG
jgi:hypothetical protein